MWNPDDYLDSLYHKAKVKFNYNSGNEKEWHRLRSEFKEAFVESLGGFPRTKSELNPRILDEKDMDTYTRQHVAYTSDEGMDVPAYLLIPKNQQRQLPAIVCCHGHGYGYREIVGLNPDDTENTGEPGYQKNFAVELVGRGYIVIVPELLGFGDRRLIEDRDKPLHESSCQRISSNLLMLGKTMAGLRVYDIFRTIDYLESREEVDASRIGCMGISGGGLVCGFSSVLDERIKVSVVSGYANTFKDSVMAMPHCIDNFVPGLLDIAELPDILGLIAPRPLLIESGTKDPIFPIVAAKKAHEKIQKIYAFYDEKEAFDTDVFEGEHQISGQKAYDWFEKWLF